MLLLHEQVCYLAVHDEIADAAGEVFVLELRVDVGDVLIHTAKLEHLAHVQVSEKEQHERSHIVHMKRVNECDIHMYTSILFLSWF